MNVKELMKRFLEEEGFKSEWEEGGVLFKFQGLKNWCEFYENHDNYLEFTISFPSEVPRCVALDLCNELNPSSVLKHYLVDDDTLVISFGEFKDAPDVPNETVMEALELLVHGAYRFDERMDEMKSYLSHPASKTVISDFEFSMPRKVTCEAIAEAQAEGTKYYGLRLSGGCYEKKYDTLFDKMWVQKVYG